MLPNASKTPLANYQGQAGAFTNPAICLTTVTVAVKSRAWGAREPVYIMAKKSFKGNSRKAKGANKNQNAVNANSNNSANQKAVEKDQQNIQETEVTPEEKIVRRAYEIAPEWKISNIAKRKFMGLPSAFQNSAGKEACIKEALLSHKDLIPDSTRYWIWLIDETNKLTRVWDFEETCARYGLNPMIVAQHLILEGKQVCNAIRLEGLAAYGSSVRMFVDPLFEDEFRIFSGEVPVKADPEKKDADE